MTVRTVGDLKSYLKAREMSPEKLAREIKLSHMTLRRLLRKPANTRIAEKYHIYFDQHARGDDAGPELARAEVLLTAEMAVALSPGSGAQADFESLVGDLERSGAGYLDIPKLESDLKGKLKDPNIGTLLKARVKSVLRGAVSGNVSLKTRAICVGALLYLLNPIDLIPDHIPVVGYLDDFAVLTLAAGCLAKEVSGAAERGKRAEKRSKA